MSQPTPCHRTQPLSQPQSLRRLLYKAVEQDNAQPILSAVRSQLTDNQNAG